MTSLAVLLTLADSRLPTGAHVHSGGIEEAIAAGMVTGLATLEAFLKRRVRTHGLLTASIAAAVHRGELAVDDADRETDARTPAPAARHASRSQGRGLIRLARRVWPDSGWEELGPRPHLAVVAGRVGALSGLAPEHNALHLVYITNDRLGHRRPATAGARSRRSDRGDLPAVRTVRADRAGGHSRTGRLV